MMTFRTPPPGEGCALLWIPTPGAPWVGISLLPAELHTALGLQRLDLRLDHNPGARAISLPCDGIGGIDLIGFRLFVSRGGGYKKALCGNCQYQ